MSLYFEKMVWGLGKSFVAGLDEVGRGSIAGPVVAASVCYKKNYQIPSKIPVIIKDSKLLTQKQRNESKSWIIANCLAWGVGVSSVVQIKNDGIVRATASAFRRSIADMHTRMSTRVDYLLIDAFIIPRIGGLSNGNIITHNKLENYKTTKSQIAIIKGDRRSFSISSASILAKVYRDELMIKFSKKPQYYFYGWEDNKGYATKKHLKAIKMSGETKYHRGWGKTS